MKQIWKRAFSSPNKQKTITSLLVVICLATLLLTTLTSKEARADLIWGINGHPLVSYPGVSITQQLDFIKDIGLTMYRVDVNNLELAPRLAELILEGKKRGITILPVLIPDVDLEKDSPEQLYKKAYNFAVRLVSQFKNDVRVVELGNELENYAIIQPCELQENGMRYNCQWGPASGVRALDYFAPRWAKVSAVLKGLSEGTIFVDPTIRKAMGTAGWGHTGAFKRMQQDGIKWDISIWHQYQFDDEWAFKELATYGHPIWVTEFNNPNGSMKSEQEQATGLTKLINHLRKLQKKYKIEAAHIYELMDETYWSPNFEAFMGLVRLVKNGEGGWKPGPTKAAYTIVKKLIKKTTPLNTTSPK
jgi:Glycosyl hydrolase catalytic core